MKQSEYFERFYKESAYEVKLTKQKNSDYANSEDAFQNFRMVEDIGLTSVEVGILTRMSDKFTRICNLITRDARVKDESIIDTLRDLSIYSKILMIYLQEKRGIPPLVNTSEQPDKALHPLENQAKVPAEVDPNFVYRPEGGSTITTRVAGRDVEETASGREKPYNRPDQTSQREGKFDRTTNETYR